MAGEYEHDRLLDQALARLADQASAAPSPGFIAAVMSRLEEEAAILRFRQLLAADPGLRRECASVANKEQLLAWLARTARHHALPLAPLLATVGTCEESANDGELDDAALDAVVGAGTAGSAYLADFLNSFPTIIT